MRTVSTKSDFTNEVRRPSYRRSQFAKRSAGGMTMAVDPVNAMKKMQAKEISNQYRVKMSNCVFMCKGGKVQD